MVSKRKRGFKCRPPRYRPPFKVEAPPAGSTMRVELVTIDGVDIFRRTFTDGATGDRRVVLELAWGAMVKGKAPRGALLRRRRK